MRFQDVSLRKISDSEWEIPQGAGMLVPGRIFASEAMMGDIVRDEALRQVINVAHLPGIRSFSIGMPDIHWGYGFPIGGVAAMDPSSGVVSPGGVGYDINCGVRLLRTGLRLEDARPRLEAFVHELSRSIPTGYGRHGRWRLRITWGAARRA